MAIAEQRRNRSALASAAAGGFAVMVCGCAMNKQEAAALLPPAPAIVATVSEACVDRAMSVEQLLHQARVAEATGAAKAAAVPTQQPPAARPCPTQAGAKPPLETGSISPTAAPAAQPTPVPAAPVSSTASGTSAVAEELFLDFEPNAVTLSEPEKARFREAVAARVLAGAAGVMIIGARGGSGNLFDQAVVAQKRARVVNELLPAKLVVSTSFDPMLPEDTVRVEFVKRPVNGN